MSQWSTRRAKVIDALLHIVAEQGLQQVSVREVAAGARVSIGTVQHYFPTKTAMLSAAYGEVVDRIRMRLESVRLGSSQRKNLYALLSELLPLDDQRIVECRIHLAFAASAAAHAELAEMQAGALRELHAGVTDAFARGLGPGATRAECAVAAHAAIAVTDGLALHAVSSDGWLSERRQKETLRRVLDVLLVDAS